jgi:CRP-like cAMP-binding protein
MASERHAEDVATFHRRTGLTSADLELIAGLPLFAGLTRGTLLALLSDAVVRSFPRRTVLFLQDEPATRFFVVLEGWVKLVRGTAGGEESIIAVFTRGQSFAEAAMFETGVYPVNASVADDARLVVVPTDLFMRQLRNDSELCLNMLAAMSRHLRHLVQQIEQLNVRSSHERLAGFLIGLCPTARGAVEIRLPFDKTLIAARLNMQPETLSRALMKLREIGIETRRGNVFVPDVSRLRRISQGGEA